MFRVVCNPISVQIAAIERALSGSETISVKSASDAAAYVHLRQDIDMIGKLRFRGPYCRGGLGHLARPRSRPAGRTREEDPIAACEVVSLTPLQISIRSE